MLLSHCGEYGRRFRKKISFFKEFLIFLGGNRVSNRKLLGPLVDVVGDSSSGEGIEAAELEEASREPTEQSPMSATQFSSSGEQAVEADEARREPIEPPPTEPPSPRKPTEPPPPLSMRKPSEQPPMSTTHLIGAVVAANDDDKGGDVFSRIVGESEL